MQQLLRYYFGIIFLFVVPYCSGQLKPQLRFFHLGIEDGLSNNKVNCLLQDKTGFIWIGTENGLNRYDGYEFMLVGGGRDKNTIVSQQVCALWEDEEGRIWIGTRAGGLHRYDPATGEIIHFQNTETKNILSDNYVRRICGDNNGILWLATPKGLTRFDPKTFQTKVFRNIPGNTNSLIQDDVRALCNSRTGRGIWVGTYEKGLCLLDPVKQKFKQYNYSLQPSHEDDDSINTPAIAALYEDDKNRLLMGGYGDEGVEYLNTLTDWTRNLKTKDYLHTTSNAFLQDRAGRYWFGCWDGLGLFDKDMKFLGKYLPEKNDPFSLRIKKITSMIQDRNGVIWLGTEGGGLCYINPASEKFLVCGQKTNDPASLSSNLIKSIYRDHEGRLWIGTRDGLDTGRTETGIFKTFQKSPEAFLVDGGKAFYFMDVVNIGKGMYHYIYKPHKYLVNKVNGGATIPKSDKYNPLPYGTFITSCIEDSKKNVWIGTFGSSLQRLDYPSGDYTVFSIRMRMRESRQSYTKSCLSYTGVTDLLEDKKGNVWIGTERALDKYDAESKMFTNYMIDKSDSFFNTNSQSLNYITKIGEDHKGNIWVGTQRAGIYMFDVIRETFIAYKVAGEASILNHIISLCIAKNGIVYAGTESGGMIVINPANKSAFTVTSADGLPDNSIAGILEDNKGNLWISTYHGLCEFTPGNPTGKKVIRTFTTIDGLPSNEFGQGAYFKDHNGRMYFGNSAGMVSFVPDDLEYNEIVAPVVLTDLQLFNKPVTPNDESGILSSNITFTKEIGLSYDQNIITISFAALGFINANNISYSYRLVGFNNEWFTANPGERSVTYTSLQPGSYVFEVRSNGTTEGNESKITSLAIEVVPPFWKTWWFRLLAAMSLAAMVYSYFNWRLKAAVKKNKEKTEIERKISALSLAALRSQMNPHFIFNSLNSIQHYIHSNQREQAETFLSTFASLIRQVLDNSAHAVIPLSDEIHTIQLYLILEKVRFGARLNYKVDIDPTIDPENILVPSMLVQPYIENAIIHGITPKEEGGSVWVEFTQQTDLIICRVRDNGIGREKALENKRRNHRKSHGMNVTKARLEILNKQLNAPVDVKITNLYDNQNKASGTQVEIFIPLQERF